MRWVMREEGIKEEALMRGGGHVRGCEM